MSEDLDGEFNDREAVLIQEQRENEDRHCREVEAGHADRNIKDTGLTTVWMKL